MTDQKDIIGIVKELPLTKGMVAIVDAEDFEWLNQYKWHVTFHSNKPYARTSKWDSQEKKSTGFPMHRMILSLTDGRKCDHIDGNTLNNTRKNLRICTAKQNQQNRLPVRGSTSKYLGVSWDKEKKGWAAVIKGKRLGRFKSEEDAAIVYDVAAQFIYGEFAHRNFINSLSVE